MTKTKLSLSQAQPLAEKIVAALQPGCERIVIAGSIRRQKAEVGDIELVAIPRYQPKSGSTVNFLTGEQEQESCLDRVLETLLAEKPNLRQHPETKWGPKFKKLQVSVGPDQWMGIDLFITTPQQWGIVLAIRTGPAEFSAHLVTQAHKNGPLPPGFQVAGGFVQYNGQPVDTPEEEIIFKLLGYGWQPPEERGNWRSWKRGERVLPQTVVA